MPHLFKQNKDAPGFYETPEKKLYRMARFHYNGRKTELSGFSSWTASLHLVLCYARQMPSDQQPHVAVIDTENLEGEVLIWHSPDLGSFAQDHEYLAYGTIRGAGYRAISFQDLEIHGVFRILPEIQDSNSVRDVYGRKLRRDIFARRMVYPAQEETATAEKLAQIFGRSLFLPIYIALLCLRSRPWYTTKISGICDDKQIIRQLTRVLGKLELTSTLAQLVGQKWLEVGTVRTSLLDVRQWVGLLSALVSEENHRQVASRTKESGMKRKRCAEDSDSPSGVRRFAVAINAVINF